MIHGEPGLEAVEHQLLVERAVVIFRHAPFLVMIGDVERMSFARPRAAIQPVRCAAERVRPHALTVFARGSADERSGSASSSRGRRRTSESPASPARRRRGRGGSIASADVCPQLAPVVPICLSPAITGRARVRRRDLSASTGTMRVRAEPRCSHPRHDLLADIAALVEVDAGEPVHVGLVRERVAIA